MSNGNQPFTPDGYKYDPRNPLTIDECWLTSADYPKLNSYASDPTLAEFVDQYIIDACGMVNSICGRFLNYQQIDQIYPNQAIWMRDYTTFTVDNLPLGSVVNVWLQVAQTFAPVQEDFFQIDTYTGMVKILPTFSTYSSVALPQFRLSSSSNIWIRYYGGYTRVNVPSDIKRATALAVDYMVGLDNITPNLRVFQTQTYKESASTLKDDPLLTRIEHMLAPYKLITLRS